MRLTKNRGKSGRNVRRKAALAGVGRARTAGFLKALQRRGLSGMLPVTLAVVFFLSAAACALFYTASPQKQADRFIKDLYTINQHQGKNAALAEEIPGVYRREFGRHMTEAGSDAAKGLRLPYGLLSRERPVDRTFAEVQELKEVLLMPETADADDSVRIYTYKVSVETHFVRDGEVVQPVTEESYTGNVCVKKSGLFRWKLDNITKSGG